MNAFLKSSLLGLVLLGATNAWATYTFPGVVRSELGLSSEPQCSVCHQGETAVGTVVTPFGKSLRDRGLVFYREDTLRAALSALATEKVDSDGDGVSDVEELKAGQDPNTSNAVSGPPEPFYGCAAAPGAPVLLALGVLALSRRRRRQ